MAHHGRTPQSVLDAPVQSWAFVPTPVQLDPTPRRQRRALARLCQEKPPNPARTVRLLRRAGLGGAR